MLNISHEARWSGRGIAQRSRSSTKVYANNDASRRTLLDDWIVCILEEDWISFIVILCLPPTQYVCDWADSASE